ncbi:hypothetical protein VD659_10765, partial [Herbiconiux sp. 11R-BC]|uniref:hypothetical protein n=1 Tax=Herbiconiux sp. 11R-BC TaxID=3111637 RepID=UPI003C023072
MHLSLRTIRRAATTGIAVAGVALLATGCSTPSTAADPTAAATAAPVSGSIIWADYGGPTNESRQLAYFDGFDADSGAEVVSVSLEDAIYYAMLDGDAGDYDVMQTSSADVLAHAENLTEVPAGIQGDLLPEDVRPYMVGGFVFGVAQGWLTKTFADGGPKDWADFFDT